MGKTAPEFSVAAQSHANKTFWWLLTAGAVWYFAGGLWALLPAAFGAYSALRSISATLVASRLAEDVRAD